MNEGRVYLVYIYLTMYAIINFDKVLLLINLCCTSTYLCCLPVDILETFLAPAGLSADSPRPPSLPLEPEDVFLLVFVWVGLSECLMSEDLTVILFSTGFI